jgi:hypothetical protein
MAAVTRGGGDEGGDGGGGEWTAATQKEGGGGSSAGGGRGKAAVLEGRRCVGVEGSEGCMRGGKNGIPCRRLRVGPGDWEADARTTGKTTYQVFLVTSFFLE